MAAFVPAASEQRPARRSVPICAAPLPPRAAARAAHGHAHPPRGHAPRAGPRLPQTTPSDRPRPLWPRPLPAPPTAAPGAPRPLAVALGRHLAGAAPVPERPAAPRAPGAPRAALPRRPAAHPQHGVPVFPAARSAPGMPRSSPSPPAPAPPPPRSRRAIPGVWGRRRTRLFGPGRAVPMATSAERAVTTATHKAPSAPPWHRRNPAPVARRHRIPRARPRTRTALRDRPCGTARSQPLALPPPPSPCPAHGAQRAAGVAAPPRDPLRPPPQRRSPRTQRAERCRCAPGGQSSGPRKRVPSGDGAENTATAARGCCTQRCPVPLPGIAARYCCPVPLPGSLPGITAQHRSKPTQQTQTLTALPRRMRGKRVWGP